jgi:Secretion system C-terminal sorting domain
MKRKLQLIGLLLATNFGFAQFTTGAVTLASGYTAQIDTNASGVTLTLKGSSTAWLGVGFGGGDMSEVSDMFIWNSSANRDYTPSGGQSAPSPDASQSWTVTTDVVVSGIRTVVATRALVSSGDYTFVNDSSPISIIWARNSSSTNLNGHNARGARTLTRSSLSVEDFSLNAASVYPNPAAGQFFITAKTKLTKVNLYSQLGALIKVIDVADDANQVQVDVAGIQAGVYLLELQNDSEKSWKKIIIN